MKGGWAGGFGERDQDQDALAGSLHMPCDCEAQGQEASSAGDANSGMANVGMPRYNVHAMLVS
ncbi:hypothetical protein, partial [Ralstonia pseudosolanacearum]